MNGNWNEQGGTEEAISDGRGKEENEIFRETGGRRLEDCAVSSNNVIEKQYDLNVQTWEMVRIFVYRRGETNRDIQNFVRPWRQLIENKAAQNSERDVTE